MQRRKTLVKEPATYLSEVRRERRTIWNKRKLRPAVIMAKDRGSDCFFANANQWRCDFIRFLLGLPCTGFSAFLMVFDSRFENGVGCLQNADWIASACAVFAASAILITATVSVRERRYMRTELCAKVGDGLNR